MQLIILGVHCSTSSWITFATYLGIWVVSSYRIPLSDLLGLCTPKTCFPRHLRHSGRKLIWTQFALDRQVDYQVVTVSIDLTNMLNNSRILGCIPGTPPVKTYEVSSFANITSSSTNTLSRAWPLKSPKPRSAVPLKSPGVKMPAMIFGLGVRNQRSASSHSTRLSMAVYVNSFCFCPDKACNVTYLSDSIAVSPPSVDLTQPQYVICIISAVGVDIAFGFAFLALFGRSTCSSSIFWVSFLLTLWRLGKLATALGVLELFRSIFVTYP